MRLRGQNQLVALFLVLSFTFYSFPQDNAQTEAWLFKRYESGASGHRTGEDVLTLMLSSDLMQRTRVAVRVCSTAPLAFALVTAGADPFQIADSVVGGPDYSNDQLIFLRAEDCISKVPSAIATELWAVPEGALLPPHVESLRSTQVRLVPLGKKAVYRGVRDYREAVNELVKNLRINADSRGVVLGYFLEQPGDKMLRRLRETQRMLDQSGVSGDRYLVRAIPWNDEFTPGESEPEYPSVFLIKIADVQKSSHGKGRQEWKVRIASFRS